MERHHRPAESSRCGITMGDHQVLCQYLTRSNYSAQDKAMLWASITTAFYGLLRASEFLAPDAVHVKVDRTLVWWSMTFYATQATIRPRRTHTCQDGHGEIVQLATGDAMCPLAALHRLRSFSRISASSQQPVSSFQSGRHLTREEMKKVLAPCPTDHCSIITFAENRRSNPHGVTGCKWGANRTGWQTTQFSQQQICSSCRRYAIIVPQLRCIIPSMA